MKIIWENCLIHSAPFSLSIFIEIHKLVNARVSHLFNMKISRMQKKLWEKWTDSKSKRVIELKFRQSVIFKRVMPLWVMTISVLKATRWHLWTVCLDKVLLIPTCKDHLFPLFHILTSLWQTCSKCKEHHLNFLKRWRRMFKKLVLLSGLLKRFLLRRTIRVMFGLSSLILFQRWKLNRN